MPFCLKAVAVLMAVACALPVVVGQPPGTGRPPGVGPQPGPAVEPTKSQLGVKVFRLERGEPEAVTAALAALLENPNAEVPQLAPPGGAPGLGVLGVQGGASVPPPSGFGGLPGGFGGAGPGGGMLGVMGMPAGGAGAIGCFIGDGGPPPVPVWRAAVQPRTRAVIVRGSEKHLKVAADLVAILDRKADAPLPKLQVVKAFALKHATAEELSEVVEALSFDDTRVATLEPRVLVVVAPDDVAKSVAELVKELDVADANLTGEPGKKPKANAGKPPE